MHLQCSMTSAKVKLVFPAFEEIGNLQAALQGCRTNQCGCHKKGYYCRPGCGCHTCTNLFESTNLQDPTDESKDEDQETNHEDFSHQCSSSSVSEDEDGIKTEVIMDTFDHFLVEQIDIVSIFLHCFNSQSTLSILHFAYIIFFTVYISYVFEAHNCVDGNSRVPFLPHRRGCLHLCG